MIERLVNLFVRKQIQMGMIKSQDISVYSYGYTLILEASINILLGIGIGLLYGDLFTVLIFSLVFIPLRSFCGGWHADKAWKCILLSNGIVILIMMAVKSQWMNGSIRRWLIIELICIAVMLWMSPVESRNKKLSNTEKKKYKKKVCLILLVQFVLLIISVFWNMEKVTTIIIMAHGIQGTVLVLEKISQSNGERQKGVI